MIIIANSVITNLYNGKHTEPGTSLNPTTGELEYRTETSIVSDWIPVKPQTAYSNTVSEDHTVGWSMPYFYDKNKKFLSSGKAFQVTFTTPANCYYMRMLGNTFRIDGKDIQINEGTVLLPFYGYAGSETIERKRVYYVSLSGNDENDGLSAQAPKKTLQSVNNLSYCTILLKSGDEFTIDAADMQFTLGSHCTLSSYGGTVRPVISGYIKLNPVWTTHKTNIYKTSLANKGFYTGANQKYDLSNIGHLLVNGEYNGKRVPSLDKLLNEGEFYVDENNALLYYYTKSDIKKSEFAFARNSHGIVINGAEQTAILGIEIKGFGRHGIWIRDSKNIQVKKNYVHHIGGCKISENGVRYGNGIEVWDNAEDIEVSFNRVTDCFDSGLSNQTSSSNKNQKKLLFKRNLVERCWYSIEVFGGNKKAPFNFMDIIYEDNVLSDSVDITKGYRYDAGQISGALFRVDNAKGNELILRNNICYLSQCYLIYCGDTSGLDGITFDGNIYIQRTGGNQFHPTSHKAAANETVLLIKESPVTADEYAKKAYVLSLISNKLPQ